jgi:ornithine carbamoyltransferase
MQAADGANCIITDTWRSMGDKNPLPEDIFVPYQVNNKIMKIADKKAIFMHCLPAYRDKEVSSEVLEGGNSVIFDEAENRLHAQKAIMHFCMN